MNELQHLIRIVKKKGQRSLQLVNYNFRKKETSKDNLLYQGILQRDFHSDQEAAKVIFRTDASNRNYRNAKSKLRSKLFNHLFFLDYEKQSYTLYEQVRYDSEKTLLQCRILMTEGATDIALRTLPGLLRTAREFELYSVAVDSLRILRDRYAEEGKLTLYGEASDELQAMQQKLSSYEHCRSLFFGTLVHINKSVSAQKRIINKIPDIIRQIRDEAQRHSSDTISLLADQLKIVFNEVQWQFDDNIALGTQLEKQYLGKSNRRVKVNLSRQEITFTKVRAYLNLPASAEGVAYARSTLKLFKPSNLGWFALAEYYFLLLMKAEDYSAAGTLFRQARTNKNFNTLDEASTQRWSIYRTYLIFFNEAKILRWGFDLEEFINSPPQYENDNFNVAARVARFMFLLREGRSEELLQCVADLLPYRSAHLDKRNNYRNSIFIRLLEVIVEKEFDVNGIEERGNSYRKKLARNQIPYEITTEMEVVPYEKLWEHIVHILRTNKVYIHYNFYNSKASQTA